MRPPDLTRHQSSTTSFTYAALVHFMEPAPFVALIPLVRCHWDAPDLRLLGNMRCGEPLWIKLQTW